MGPKSKNGKTIGKCGKCSKFFTSIGALQSHVTYFHKSKATCTLNGRKVNFNKDTKTSKPGLFKKQQSNVETLQIQWPDTIQDEISKNYKNFKCADCQYVCGTYKNIVKHIDSTHRESLISFFFPNQEVFLEWKNKMERTTNCSYEPRIKLELRKIYLCSAHIATKDKQNLTICTSIITIREYNRGIQVFFFRLHSGHVADYYQPPPYVEKYLIYDKNNDIDKIIQNSGTLPLNDTKIQQEKEALVSDFRKILVGLSKDCVNLEIENLLQLFSTAKSMEESMYDILKETKVNIKQGSPKVLIENVNGNINISCTRENEPTTTEPMNTTPLIINTFSLSNSDISENNMINDKRKVEDKTKIDFASNVVDQPTISKYAFTPENKNFNDTYENFIAQHSGGVIRKKPIKNQDIQIKTVAIPVDPMFTTKLDNVCNEDEKSSKVKSLNNCNKISVPSKVSKTSKSLFSKKKALNIQSGSSFYDNKTPKKLPSSMHKVSKMKSKVKTKLGQFSPKKNEINNKKRESTKDINTLELDHSKDSPKTKFQDYEVKERDNDCNILILKF